MKTVTVQQIQEALATARVVRRRPLKECTTTYSESQIPNGRLTAKILKKMVDNKTQSGR